MFFSSGFRCHDSWARDYSNVINTRLPAMRYLSRKIHVTISNNPHGCVNRENSATQSCNFPHLCTFVPHTPYTIDIELLGCGQLNDYKPSCENWFLNFRTVPVAEPRGRPQGSSVHALDYQSRCVLFNARYHRNLFQGTVVKYVKFYFIYLEVSRKSGILMRFHILIGIEF